METVPVLDGIHSAETFHPAFLEAFFGLVARLEAHPQEFHNALQGKIIASVFEEPSTRTRLSFEVAAQRLGAGVITVADPATSSRVKGESLKDSARVLGGYADLMVLRHPRDGASRLVAQASGIPVVNGGDGRLGHPTQTLIDLYTLRKEWEGFEGRVVGILGDLRYGRTARSLAWGLAACGASILLLPGPGLSWEGGLEERILRRFEYRRRPVKHPLIPGWTGSSEAWILEPRNLVQGDLFGSGVADLNQVDALYLTRLQEERGARQERGAYPGVDQERMGNSLLSSCVLLHPLPRQAELPDTLDSDPRLRCFEQARLGPVVRQAVFLALLQGEVWSIPAVTPLPTGEDKHDLGSCRNSNCVTLEEEIPPPWRVEGRKPRLFLCAFCDTPLHVEYLGCRSTRRVHPLHSASSGKIRAENLRPFASREQAELAEYAWGG
ncbi:MAG TPA: hypothetical protein DDW23_08565 [Planctomycetes bacterium]|nr:hypothetical protein [Planctomycetota bacterium]